MRTHAPCGTLTSKHMQIFVPRYVPSLLRNKEHTYHVAAMASPPCDPAFFLPIVFARAAQNPHTPGGNAAVERCKEAYDSFSPSHTDAAFIAAGERGVFNRSLKAAGPIFQKLKPVAGAVLWQLTTPSQAQYFRSKHGHITA